ncbi:MAG: HTH-type transcriptional regulator DmlR [Herbaspirillum frisingense]|uniref:HTH-type transcriptional regulator DmlR n=1 Tax=Herbaspirillum frisingense TaxID=92645 RepID=A0A7V8FZZ5_9BURK|nr:MAG: HTH-type transcriptional regulator DmlR [Herbaspirillum frisingense]
MIKVEDLQLMAALARSASLSEAARQLNLTPPALSMRLRALEAAMGVLLATRTARRLALTDDGQALAQEAQGLLARMAQLPAMFEQQGRGLDGKLKIAAPFGYGRQRVAPLVARLARLHPGLRIELDLRETPWPDRHEADIVFHIGSVRDSSWVARTVAGNERWLCASPAYLKRRGKPAAPRDLLTHACICIRENEEDGSLWHYRREKQAAEGRAGARESLRVQPALLSNDGATARYWAEQGLGFVLRSQWDVEEPVRQGRLVRVLEGWQFDQAPILIMTRARTGLPTRVRVAAEFLLEALSAVA